MVPSFSESHLRSICDFLGETRGGLSNTEIDERLSECGIEDAQRVVPVSTLKPSKRERLFRALSARQRQDRCGNHVGRFLEAALNPVRYVRSEEVLEYRRDHVNQILAFSGLSISESGKLVPVPPVKTLGEARARASRLRAELGRRGVHPDVLRFCKAELLERNCFHAVLEASKSLSDKLQKKTGLSSDGAKLVDASLAVDSGALAINRLETETERSEQVGLASLIKGMFSAFRNRVAHEPRIDWGMNEEDALDILSLISLLHRKLDLAVPRTPTIAASGR